MKPLELPDATRVAAIVIPEEDGQRKFAAALCNAVPACWEKGVKDWKPPSRAAQGTNSFDEFAKAGRKLMRAIKAIQTHDVAKWEGQYRLNPLFGFDDLANLIEQILPMADFLGGKKIGRPKQPYKDGFELFVGLVLVPAITNAGGQKPTCNRHHQSGSLVDLLIALRPYLPPDFVPEDLDKWPWAKLERILSAKSRHKVFAVRGKVAVI
jgi:hypothetical protein